MSETKLSKDDPAVKAFIEIVDALEPFSRVEQLRILSAACALRGDHGYAALFGRLAEKAEKDAATQLPGEGSKG